ncbi:MAG TPA: PAS domain S-box protein [Bryobacteraceae bacterium]|nr:PAS domain S-box protein [Bryobacteraceae bacterium]
MLDKIPALLWATDFEPRFTSLTGAGLRATDICAKDYAGKPIDALFDCSKFGQKAAHAHRRALQGTGSAFDVDVGGRELEAHVEPLRGQDGEVVGVIGVALDATERLLAERAMRLSEQSYRSLIEEAPYAICRATESGQLLQVNRAMLEMLGYDPGAEADLLVRDLPLIFAAPEGFDALRKGLLGGNSAQGIESTWLRRDGQEIQVRVGGRAIRDLAGAVLYLDVLAENVTERKQLEARLSQAQEDAGHRTARRRSGTRLQQPAHGDRRAGGADPRPCPG